MILTSPHIEDGRRRVRIYPTIDGLPGALVLSFLRWLRQPLSR